MLLQFDALGTHWWINLPINTSKNIKNELTKIVTEFEDNYSRFKDTSLIGILNSKKQLNNPPAELLNMLRFALDVYNSTEKIFNISIGSHLEKSGYGKKSDPKSSVSSDLNHDLSISPNKIKISRHVRLDLGGFGKGWLIEKLSAWLKHQGVEDFYINGGGDITACGQANKFLIEHPTDSSLYIGEVTLKNSSMASSSNIKRSWMSNNKKHSHIIHPEDKKISTPLSMHVITESILMADTFATVFMLVSREKRLQLSNQYGLEFLEIQPDMQTFKTPGFKVALNT